MNSPPVRVRKVTRRVHEPGDSTFILPLLQRTRMSHLPTYVGTWAARGSRIADHGRGPVCEIPHYSRKCTGRTRLQRYYIYST